MALTIAVELGDTWRFPRHQAPSASSLGTLEPPNAGPRRDRAVGNMQETDERRGRIPAFFDRQLPPRCAEPIDGEDCGDARPRDIGPRRARPRLEDLIESQLAPQRQTEQRGPPVAAVRSNRTR